MEQLGDIEHIVPQAVADSYISAGAGSDGPDVVVVARPIAP